MEAGKGSADLEQEVLSQGLCTSCGACVNICPYIEVVRDKVAVIEPCGLTEGKCYDFCPRTPTDIAALDKFVFGKMRSEYSLGPYISIEMAQAKDSEIRCRAQYGGVVSALMKYALDTGEISNAVLTSPFYVALMPTSVVAQESNQLLECAGSSYISSATLAKMNEATKQGRNSIGLVGIPCQVLALRKMQAAKHETGAKEVKLVIGLFCTWALSYKGFYEFLKDKVDPSLIRRIDIPPPPGNIMVLETAGGDVRFSLVSSLGNTFNKSLSPKKTKQVAVIGIQVIKCPGTYSIYFQDGTLDASVLTIEQTSECLPFHAYALKSTYGITNKRFATCLT